MEGYTLALDFPKSKKIDKLLDKLDKLVLKYDGRFYLTKDSRMSNLSCMILIKEFLNLKNFVSYMI